MMWWKKHKWKVIAPVLILAILAGAFWYGGGAPGLQGWTAGGRAAEESGSQPAQQADLPAEKDAAEAGPLPPEPSGPAQQPQDEPQQEEPGGDAPSAPDSEEPASQGGGADAPSSKPQDTQGSAPSGGMEISPETGKDKYLTDPVPEGKPLPVEPQDAEISDTAYACTLSISCASILDHMDWLDPEKVELVPEDGWILEPTAVTFYEGESVFNVLQRTCKQQGIHMEFVNTPMYNSAYIEGIHNLYEFDCGELSGWMYQVNGWFPNYGCSRYQLQDGDVVEWEYTCDLGVDIGGYYAAGG